MGRKGYIGLAFMGCCTYLIALGIYRGADLLAMSTPIGAMAGGVGMLMWGYKSEYQAQTKTAEATGIIPPPVK